jgi:hypothetical protein
MISGRKSKLQRTGSELGNEEEFSELERRGDNIFAERGGVVLVRVTNLPDEAVGAKAF